MIENDAACRHCGFSLEGADRVFGVAPTLSKPLTDPQRVLSGMQRRKVDRQVANLERRFPQIELAVVLMPVPAQAPMGMYAFWLFNRGQLSSTAEGGGKNRLVLLLLDTNTGRAASMVGYGLEPFFPEMQLQMCVQAYAQLRQRDGVAAGVLAFVKELDLQLRAVWRQIPRQFGLRDEHDWIDMTDDDDADVTLAELNY